jgi:hypothetical protein
MGLMQMDYPRLNDQYFISSFIAGLREGIKHYLIPHSPQTFCETYWKANELEKDILHKKNPCYHSLLLIPNPPILPQQIYYPNLPIQSNQLFCLSLHKA